MQRYREQAGITQPVHPHLTWVPHFCESFGTFVGI
jgi:hypothetical protein